MSNKPSYQQVTKKRVKALLRDLVVKSCFMDDDSDAGLNYHYYLNNNNYVFVVKELSNHESAIVRSTVAKHGFYLNKLARDPSQMVRNAVAEHGIETHSPSSLIVHEVESDLIN